MCMVFIWSMPQVKTAFPTYLFQSFLEHFAILYLLPSECISIFLELLRLPATNHLYCIIIALYLLYLYHPSITIILMFFCIVEPISFYPLCYEVKHRYYL